MKLSPKVSVIMPVYNSERYLREAIESVLNQTFEDFEFLIFDDGSTDASKSIIMEYAKKDARIIPFFSDINCGYVVHLNKGIERAKGEFIARMDSDDVSLGSRFEKQVNFLINNTSVGVVGSSTIRIDGSGKEVGVSTRLASPIYLYWQCFFNNPFSHPTVMFRKRIIMDVGAYNTEKLPAEDYDLWVRLLDKCELANIEEPLLKYREHTNSISVRKKDLQLKNSIESLNQVWGNFSIKISANETKFLKGFHKGYDNLNASDAFPLFYKIFKLRAHVKQRFKVLNNEVEADFYNRSLYLAIRCKKASLFQFFILAICLTALYPLVTIKLVLYGRK